jgi:hypothetical protein
VQLESRVYYAPDICMCNKYGMMKHKEETKKKKELLDGNKHSHSVDDFLYVSLFEFGL